MNQIEDITPLAGLSNLTWLNLSGNEIVDITSLAGLVNLTYLDSGYNNIDVDQIYKLKSQLPNCVIKYTGNAYIDHTI